MDFRHVSCGARSAPCANILRRTPQRAFHTVLAGAYLPISVRHDVQRYPVGEKTIELANRSSRRANGTSAEPERRPRLELRDEARDILVWTSDDVAFGV